MKNSREKKNTNPKFVRMEEFEPLRVGLKNLRSIDDAILELEKDRAIHCKKLRPVLRTFRLSAGMASGDFAEIIGITQGYYADIERGRRSCTPGVIKKLSDWVTGLRK
jgi:hypothetical protein